MGTAKRERQKSNRSIKNIEMARQLRRQRMRRTAIRVGAVIVLGVIGVIGLAWIGGAFDSDEDTADTLPEISIPEISVPVSTGPGELTILPFTYGGGECAPAEKPAEPVTSFTDAPKLCIDPTKTYTATFATSEGDITVALDTPTVPGTVNNFVTLARYGYYDDSLIFRTDPSIEIIQGGGKTNTDTPGYSIPDEGTGFTYETGQLVMARTSQPNSAGAQYFFVTGPAAASLDAQGTYVVFGEVTEGLDIAQAIIALVGDDGQTPTKEVSVESVTITES